ncbi:MAG: hypothetical protein HN790_17580 [Methylococcales bacterium]|nr:hypothetical protein [Methylococcales bacterium]
MDTNVFEIDEDPDVLIDFFEEFSLKVEEIDNIIMGIIDDPQNTELFNEVQTILNMLSGKASTYNLSPVVEPVKTIEMLLDRILKRKVSITEDFRTLLAQALNLVQFIAQEASEKASVSFSLFIEVQAVLQPVATFEDNFDETVTRSLAVLEGQSHKDDADDSLFGGNVGIDLFGDDDGVDLFGDDEPEVASQPAVAAVVEPVPETKEEPQAKEEAIAAPKEPFLTRTHIIQRDLSLFRVLGHFSDKRRPGSLPRTEVIIPIALGMNAMGAYSGEDEHRFRRKVNTFSVLKHRFVFFNPGVHLQSMQI